VDDKTDPLAERRKQRLEAGPARSPLSLRLTLRRAPKIPHRPMEAPRRCPLVRP
jgi:hypothetical protein